MRSPAASIAPRTSSLDVAVVFAMALGFYSLTLAPSVVWGDSAMLSWRAFLGRLRFDTAADHPLFILVGWLFTALPGDVARNVNFVSAVFGALAVMLVYRCGRQLGASRVAAMVGAAALCVSHAFWLHSVIAEVYTLNAFFVAATISLLLAWRRQVYWGWLVAAAVTFAIGLTNHLVLATAGPGALAFVVAIKGRAMFTRTFLILTGLAAAALLVAIIIPPPAVAAAFWRVWNGPPGVAEYFGLNVAPAATVKEAAYYVLFLAYQFPSVSLLLGLLGARGLLQNDRRAALLLLSTIAVNATLFVRHTVWPSAQGTKYVFYIADYVVFSILCAVGTQELLRWIAQRRVITSQRVVVGTLLALVAVVPPVIYAAMPAVMSMAGVNLISIRPLPYRDGSRFFFNPNKRGEDGARRFGRQAFDIVRPNAVIFADFTPAAVLQYMQVAEQQRPDVLIAFRRDGVAEVQWLVEDGQRRPTYLASAPLPGYYDMRGLTGEYEIIPAGPILEVRPTDHAVTVSPTVERTEEASLPSISSSPPPSAPASSHSAPIPP
jgi:hypothetical protein